jgi:hypothetical protein
MLTRRTPLRRLTRLATRNAGRKAASYRRNFGARADAVRQMRCLGCVAAARLTARRLGLADASEFDAVGQATPTQAAHAVARGMGGVKGDRRSLVPLCSLHHAEAGEARTTARAEFEARYRINLQHEAGLIAERLDSEGFE